MSAPTLHRRLGVPDAVIIGLGSMIGAGVFSAFAPAARAAGSGLLVALAAAAVVAYCNATSSARLAAKYPASGGTYVYGRERLGPFWGYLAGWAFVVGKTASCAAMALTFASYAWPEHLRPSAVAGVVLLSALGVRGVQKSAWATRAIVAVVLTVLALVVVGCFAGGHAGHAVLGGGTGVHGVLQAAGLLFFAFAGYARIATLGEEVRDPARTIPRAISVALGRFGVPHRAELAVAAVVVVLVLTTDLRGAIGFSSFGVLAYYGIANASAFTLRADEGRPPRWLPPLGVLGCAALAVSLPLVSVVTGAGVLGVGALAYLGTRRRR